MSPPTLPFFLETGNVVRTAEKAALKGKHSWHRAPAREPKVSKRERSDSSPRLLSVRSNWCWQSAAWHRWQKQKREIRRRRLRSLSKRHSYRIPLTSPLQIKIVTFCQLHWKAEPYPTQRSSLDKTADFLQTKFPLWSLQRSKCQKSSLAWQTWLEHQWGKAPYPVSFSCPFCLEIILWAAITVAASGLFIGILCLISLTLVATLIPRGNRMQLKAGVKFCQHSLKQSRIC